MKKYLDLDCIQQYKLCCKKMQHVDRLMKEYGITKEEVGYDSISKYHLPPIDKLINRIAKCIAIQKELIHPRMKSQKQLRKDVDRHRHHVEFMTLYEVINKRSAITRSDLLIDYEASTFDHVQISSEELVSLIGTTASGRRCTDFYDDLIY